MNKMICIKINKNVYKTHLNKHNNLQLTVPYRHYNYFYIEPGKRLSHLSTGKQQQKSKPKARLKRHEKDTNQVLKWRRRRRCQC